MMNTQNLRDQNRGGGCCCSEQVATPGDGKHVGVTVNKTLPSEKIRIQGVVCGGCVKTLEEAIFTVSGVEDASVELATGVATVFGVVDTDSLILAINKMGYAAEVITESVAQGNLTKVNTYERQSSSSE